MGDALTTASRGHHAGILDATKGQPVAICLTRGETLLGKEESRCHALTEPNRMSGLLERLGKYELLERLAAGGMGELYLAREVGVQGFKRRVALKKILPNLAQDPDFVEMFLNEARIAGQLAHPNIVQVYEVAQADGIYFIAMEYVDGPNLRTLAAKARRTGTPLPTHIAVKIVSHACDGLGFAHAFCDPETNEPLRIIHRDVSPDNIIIGAHGMVKVADFGIAKAMSQRHRTEAGILKGKLPYMAPEQKAGGPIDHRADIYSIGVVLHELVFGKRPDDRFDDMMLQHVLPDRGGNEPAPKRPDLTVQLLSIIERALAPSPGARFSSCAEMRDALERLLHPADDPIGSQDIANVVSRLQAKPIWKQSVELEPERVEIPTRPPTAEMKPANPSVQALSPDEDVRAPTLTLSRSAGSSEQTTAKSGEPYKSNAGVRSGTKVPPVIIADGIALMNANPTTSLVHPSPHPAQTTTLPKARSNARKALLSGVLILVFAITGGAIVIALGSVELAPIPPVTPAQESPVDPPLPSGQDPPLAETTLSDTPTETKTKQPPPARQPARNEDDHVNLKAEHDKLIKQGRAALESEKASAAISAFRRALKLAPGSAAARAGLGIALVLSGTGYKEAVPLLKQVVREDDSNAEAWLNLGMSCQFTGDNKCAKEAYRKYLLLRPTGEVAGLVQEMLKELGP